MNNKSIFSARKWSVGTKLTIFTFALVSVIFTVFVFAIGYASSELLERRAVASVSNEARDVANMVEMFNHSTKGEVARFSKMLAISLPGKFVVDAQRTVDIAGKPTPILKNGDTELNLDFSIPDRFTAQTGVTATIFVKSGEDFVRISTSVKKENGERAVGTTLDRSHSAYPLLQTGQSYSGAATLFGKPYITEYVPFKDDAGKVIGVLYVGLDISPEMKILKEKIKAIKVGETGYFYVLNAKEGKDYGTLLIHPVQEGKNILDAKDSNGREFIKEILEKKEGVSRYPWINKEIGETAPREKVAAFTYFKEWNWVIAGGAYTGELTQEYTQLRNRYGLFGLIALVVFAALFFVVVRRNISVPLAKVKVAAKQLAGGDLTMRMAVDRQDEIGELMQAMNGISEGLAGVVGNVRQGTDQIATASSQIAAGNLDLSTRTEEQASALEETASSMEELTSTVKQNADNARQANQLAGSASSVAVKGGTVVAQVVDTMGSINESSKKIVDIIGVIDGIAFQTNILALNAAVEAARAGEQGRGFAVVAAEVRNLAQRSAAAAKEIKKLIGESVEKVGAGSRLVEQAGTTMSEIVTSVKRVTDIMEEISAASQEQSTGIEEVNRAIAQMDQVTQQNAALVEQATAAAQSMQDQATQLARAVSVFKLAGTPVNGNQIAAAQPAASVGRVADQRGNRAKNAVAPASPRRPPAVSKADGWEEF
jgi:methyl-accepting chemotaxis protein-2 (aspartate sensor receptor)